MSRVSISRRLAAIVEAAERIDPFSVRVHRLPPALRIRYDLWRAENARRIAQYTERDGPGGAYAAMIDGEGVLLPMPSNVARALGVDDGPVITASMSERDLAATYGEMVGG